MTPPVIGLSGGIGAGKSTVGRMLADLGCVVVDSDAAGRAALRDTGIRGEIVGWWGDVVLDDDGMIDRGRIAAIVFADPAQRRRLEALVHPWIEARRLEAFAAAPPGAPALVIDAPLLFEAGLDGACDATIFVDASRSTRLARVAERGWDDTELRRREESQLPLDVKRDRADHVLDNDGDLVALRDRVRRLLNHIVEDHHARRPELDR